uniref:Receptor L-domain domain-containing protein n=1 Tax=Chromera velia CCMP2878 TaxID=1169474 RepID=A0A0G4H0U2_9ALVE|eukprot:Cvel_5505.t1-p1 / transcript=Cvel_5505.t1 / gene=Cvel_5505 / organism=Chromera_velia_CCMP2878 / gene_product=hypothetical protein / transcript_product=hypothetical protein / location=Cvel_scaffold257:89900-90403(+) / protein_length=168 / sequence_SO=supercontig / SO=protein_coding / is_pseudo=false
MEALESVNGNFTVGHWWMGGNPSLRVISLPGLTSTGGYFEVYGTALTSLSVSALTCLEGALLIGQAWWDANPSLESIHLPQLEEVGGSFVVKSNQALSELVLRSCPEEEGEEDRGECLLWEAQWTLRQWVRGARLCLPSLNSWRPLGGSEGRGHVCVFRLCLSVRCSV